MREDIVQLDAAADARGLKRTEWLVMLLRRRLHATSPPPRGDRVLIAQSWRELNRIGINLNKAGHALPAATLVDRKRGVKGKRGSVRGDLGGRRSMKKKRKKR